MTYFLLNIFVFYFIAVIQAAVTNPKVVGGQNAAEGQFPHQVSILLNERHHCGGSIIGQKWVLTAAHCIAEVVADELKIHAGSTLLNAGGENHDVAEGRVHSGWNPNTIQHDIAVLKTTRDFTFNNNIRPIPLNTADIRPGTQLQISGWGLTSYPEGTEPNNLQYLDVPAISWEECKLDAEPLFDTQLCTLSPTGEGSCRGDSGGPLMFNQKLAGIVSWGRLCALGRPDVYTNVAKYLEWITDAIKE